MEEILIQCRLKYRTFKGRKPIKRHGQATGNNAKKKIHMFYSGIPKIPGVTTSLGEKSA